MKRLFTQVLLCSTFVVLFAIGLSAQKTISGTVIDASNGDPLIGANIIITGSSTGTITDFDGNYTLAIPAGANSITISYAGYENNIVDVTTGDRFDVSLASGQLLDEVVVIGYGTVKKRDVTGSVASLKEEDFNKGVLVSPDQLLQGRVPGVNIIPNSGQPGGKATIKVRGNNSIRAGADPLYVVDGIPLDGRTARAGLLSNNIGTIENSNPLNFLNPSDIASIEVLKDASSAAIYGSRASNGVILITTKKASEGATDISFNAATGIATIAQEYDILDADQYVGALNDAGLGSGGNGGSSVDAFDEILQTGITQNYNFSIGSSSDNSKVRFSAGLQDVEGIVKESDITRYTGVLNSQFNFLDDRVGIDALLISSHTIENIAPISTNAGFTGNLVGQALQWNPTIPLVDGSGAFVNGNNNPTSANIAATTINPLQLLNAHDELSNTTTLLASLSPYINITDELQYRYRFGVNYGVGTTRGNVRGTVNVQGIEGLGFAALAENTLTTQLHTHTLGFNKDLDNNISFSALAGFEYQKFDFKGYGMGGSGFTELNFDNTNAIQNGDVANRIIFSFADPISELQSFFGRVNFSINNKYLVTATGRYDGSSKFGDNNKYGFFPSLAVGWVLSEEDFLSGNESINNLKVRAGWGRTGNQEFPAGSAVDRFALLANQSSNQINTGNPDLQWEASTTINIGLDYALFNYKVTGSIDWYRRVTDNLLLDPFIQEPGPAIRAWQNIDGEVVNKGLELALTTFIVDNEDFGFDITANASFLNNKFQNYEGAPIETGNLFGQGSSGAFIQRHVNGEPLNTFFLRDFQGFDDSGQSITGDMILAGDPNADVIIGVTPSIRFSDFNFSMNWNGAFGHQIYNNTAMSVIPIGNLGSRNIDASLIGTNEALSNPISSSTRFLEDGDFFKLSNATLSYNIGDIGSFKNMNVSLTGQNLIIISDYSGFDPEVNTVNLRNGIPSSGIEYIPYPTARTVVLGVNVSF